MMKVIKKNKLPNQTCIDCECEVKISWKDLQIDHCSCRRNLWKCPLCNATNLVKFKEEENDAVF